MGESITEGSVAAWQKQVGEGVHVDDVVCEVATDKVSVEIKSPHAGVITELLAAEEDTIEVGAPLFKVDTSAAPPPAAEKPAAEQPAATPAATPAAAPAATPAAAPAPPKPAAPKPAAPAPSAAPSEGRQETRVPMTRMRKRIAERLKASQNTNALLTTFNEIDMHNLFEMRNKFKDDFQKKHGVKLGFMSAFVKAASNALENQPVLNSVIDGSDIVYRNYVDISIAVSAPSGLVVPVLRDVHNMNFADIEKEIANLGAKAQANQLAIEDMVGGTFTVSNGGVFGSLMSTPIVNPPQSAVLGMHAVFKRPWVVNDEIVIRPIMLVAMSYDHRLVDGREAVTFLRAIKRQIEEPTSMLLDL